MPSPASLSWRSVAALAALFVIAAPLAESQRRRRSRRNFLPYVQRFADALIAGGVDLYGPDKTPMWAGVIDARDLSVPRDGVAPPAGVREHDRAVGGSNLYHDAITLRVFRVLSAVTNDPKYAAAARAYMSAFLERARSENTGFLAWGEHLYYDLYRDQPAAARKWHELLEFTPPWSELWEVNPDAVAAAISALRHHYYAGDPTALFNRHAHFDRAGFQPPGGQPWIKHSGLYAYSFMFLYKQTGDSQWLRWSRGAAGLYWDRRNPQSNLTLSCIGDPRENSAKASAGQAELAYWLLKAYQLNPRETEFWSRAVALLKAWDAYAYDPAIGQYHSHVTLDGKPSGDIVHPWHFAYGSPTILPAGRIAAYFARTEEDPAFLAIAERVARIAQNAPIPEQVSLEGIACALNLSLDLYSLTNEQEHLAAARVYAQYAIDNFWVRNPAGGLFVRAPGDHYYEAKTGVGHLLAGLLRLHINTSRYASDPGLYDWSF